MTNHSRRHNWCTSSLTSTLLTPMQIHISRQKRDLFSFPAKRLIPFNTGLLHDFWSVQKTNGLCRTQLFQNVSQYSQKVSKVRALKLKRYLFGSRATSRPCSLFLTFWITKHDNGQMPLIPRHEWRPIMKILPQGLRPLVLGQITAT